MKQTTKRATKGASKDSRRKPKAPTAERSQEVIAEVMPYDDTLLEYARTQWQFGDWKSLASITQEKLQHHPQRAKLALLAATGHFQLGNQQDAHLFIRLAEDWGCSKKLIAQMLVSGAHNSLGCATALIDQDTRAKGHFRLAVTLGGIPGDVNLLTDARATKQFSFIIDHEFEQRLNS
jgi:hypothetical protein